VTGEPTGRPPSSLTLRLAAAFLTVAVAAVGVLAALIVVTADRQTGELLDRQHRDAATAAARIAAAAYQSAGGWSGADLTAVAAVAASAQARLVLTDDDGVLLAAPTDELARMMAGMHGVATVEQPRGHPVIATVLLDGRTVGFVSLTFPLAHDTPAGQVRTALWRAAVSGTALAAAVALGIAMLVAARLTRPLVALTAAAGRLAAGDRSARADVHGPGELGVLAVAFDDMATQLTSCARPWRSSRGRSRPSSTASPPPTRRPLDPCTTRSGGSPGSSPASRRCPPPTPHTSRCAASRSTWRTWPPGRPQRCAPPPLTQGCN
jgi:two-component system, OmpR family, sensor histidine kinase BaeS